jgi:pentose-5-phosphate-3-epimerase
MLGYTGRISIDGGVNLTSAEEIKYWEIDRVSVGSFFQKSKDAQLAYMKLQLALNLKEQMFDV